MFKGFTAAQRTYDNMFPDDYTCIPCEEGDCDYHEYHEYIWVNKVSYHTAKKDHTQGDIRAGDYYKSYIRIGVIVDGDKKTPVKEYTKTRIDKNQVIKWMN